MALRIAFDLDGVLADMDSELARQADILFGTQKALPKEEAGSNSADSDEPETAPIADVSLEPTRLNLSARQQRRLWRHVGSIDGFWEDLREIEPGVIRRLAAVATERRWEVMFLTRRPESGGATAQVQTQRWLQAQGFTLPSVYVVRGSRGLIAAALGIDVVVDDRPENCLDVVVDSKARAILVWRTDDKLLPPGAKRLGIGIVKTVGECLDILAQLDTPEAHQQPGVMSRVLRLLGLSETPGA